MSINTLCWLLLIITSITLSIHVINHPKEIPPCIQLDTGTKGILFDGKIYEGGTLRDITVKYEEIDCE